MTIVLLAALSWSKDAGAQTATARATRLAPLDAHGYTATLEIAMPELIRLMSKTRPLTEDELQNLRRGCPGFVCVYQGLGLKRWPEAAPGTRAYLRLEDALKRRCPAAQTNFVFLKQACWDTGKPPIADATTGEVPLSAITRLKPGGYSFNYAVYFPETATYAWINHRDYGFPMNLLEPQKAYISLLPPPLEEYRPAQVYCSTCH
jgi:hypothetical protein